MYEKYFKDKQRSKNQKSKYTNDKNLSIKLLNILHSDRSDDHHNRLNYNRGSGG